MKFERLTSKTPLPASRVLQRLAEMEEQGIAFYQGLQEGTKSPRIAKLAGSLIKAEARHRDRFMTYAYEAAEGEENKDLAGELPAEALRLLNTNIFVSGDQVKSSAPYARDIDMVKLAIRAEENAALLLEELKSFVPKKQRPYIARVVKEEWKHKARLEEVMKKHFL